MLILIVVFLFVIFLINPKNKLKLKNMSVQPTKNKKSINIQSGTLGVLLLIYVCNVLYNWNYFKQYDGPHTTGYLVAKYIEYAIRYSIGFSILLLLYSVFIKKSSDKP